jgi:phenylalanyl-tRNA synthetase beta chain
MTGLRAATAWDDKPEAAYDFYDLKGRIEQLLGSLRLQSAPPPASRLRGTGSPHLSTNGEGGISYAATASVAYLHPGKAAEIMVNGQVVGIFGELHPVVKARYEFGEAPVVVADFDLDVLRGMKAEYALTPVPELPAIFEDIAVIVDEAVPAAQIEALIRATGGEAVTNVRLFDLYRGDQLGAGKKSLAYSLTYQATDRTLTDAEAAAIRNRIVKRLEQELGAKLRS